MPRTGGRCGERHVGLPLRVIGVGNAQGASHPVREIGRRLNPPSRSGIGATVPRRLLLGVLPWVAPRRAPPDLLSAWDPPRRGDQTVVVSLGQDLLERVSALHHCALDQLRALQLTGREELADR